MSFASQAARSGGQYTDSELDLSGLGSALWRKKWLILGPTILIGLLTLIVVQVITPRYQSESRVIVEGRDNVYLRPDADKDRQRQENPRRDPVQDSGCQRVGHPGGLRIIARLAASGSPAPSTA